MKKWLRRIHRWLGLLMALQILAWMASGFFFALYPIETIRGEHLAAEPGPMNPQGLEGLVPPAVALDALSKVLGGEFWPDSLALVRQQGETWYRFMGEFEGSRISRVVRARDGWVRERLGREAARRIAVTGLASEFTPSNVELVTDAEAGSEYRGRSLPLWRITFDQPESLHVYVDAWSGDVVAQRTTRWRIFDFLWMLHIMDFDDRDDFNTILLQTAALLGLILALTGVAYWGFTTRLWRRPTG